MKRINQCEKVLNYLKDYGSITQMEALFDISVMRLSSRICELKKKGYPIKDEFVVVKNRYGQNCFIKKYYLDEKTCN